MRDTILAWGFLGFACGLLYLAAIESIAFGDIVPPQATVAHKKAIVGTVLNHQYTDKEIVNAIYQAEGGSSAQYPYGIRSILCESQEACRKICENTVRNNRKRYTKLGRLRNKTYIEFLGSRYCPVKGSSLSNSERLLNKNWVKNVTWYLNHPKKA